MLYMYGDQIQNKMDHLISMSIIPCISENHITSFQTYYRAPRVDRIQIACSHLLYDVL
jgi:hypothetical protein